MANRNFKFWTLFTGLKILEIGSALTLYFLARISLEPLGLTSNASGEPIPALALFIMTVCLAVVYGLLTIGLYHLTKDWLKKNIVWTEDILEKCRQKNLERNRKNLEQSSINYVRQQMEVYWVENE